MARWSVPISKYVTAAKGDVEKAVRAVSLEVYTKLLIRSPVDTGRFRGNWMIGMAVIPEAADEQRFNKPGAPLPEEMAKLSIYRIGATIHMRNNLPYAVALENGHSQQAPSGVVRVTAAEFGAIVSRKARETRAGMT